MEVDTTPAIGLMVQVPGGDARTHMDVDAPTTVEGSTLQLPGADARARSSSLSTPLDALRLQEATGPPRDTVEDNAKRTPQPTASDSSSTTVHNTSQPASSNSDVELQDATTNDETIPASPLAASQLPSQADAGDIGVPATREVRALLGGANKL